jgi:hypothetical protein
MPIEHSTAINAIGAARAADYTVGEWIPHSKDVLVADDEGRMTGLGDQIIIRVGSGGMVVSPGDMVVWAGLLVLAAEGSIAWQRRSREQRETAGLTQPAAEGGAAT